MGDAVLRSFACAVAGTLAWLLCEPWFPKQFSGEVALRSDPRWAAVEQAMFLLLGALIGATAGLIHGWRKGGRRNLLLSGALGLVFGAVGGGFGHVVGGAFFTAASIAFGLNNPIARVAGFVPMGMAIGAAVGASALTVRSTVSGAIGGLLAGFAGGALFDPVAQVFGTLLMPANMVAAQPGQQIEVGAPGRAVASFGLGLLIGLFTALVDRATRRAWIRLVLGRNEGKEWPVDAAQTLIGRDERAHVPLFGDPTLPPLAAVIARQGAQYVLHDPGTPMGVGHNGVRVPQAVLGHGDTIQVGGFNLQFFLRAGAARAAAEGRARAQPVGGGAPAYGPPAGVSQAPQPAYPMPGPAPHGMAPAPAVAVGQVLVALSGPLTGQRFVVSGSLELGREAAGVPLGFDSQASRRHAVVAQTPAGLQVTDLGSTNGTFVNGQRVPMSPLRPGDSLTIGSTSFRIE